MKVSISTDAPTKVDADLLVVGVRTGQLGKDKTTKQLDKATRGALTDAAKLEDFQGKAGETLRVPGRGVQASAILLVGLGDAALKENDLRVLGVKASQAAAKFGSVALVLPEGFEDRARAARVATEGLVGGAYRYTRYLTGDRLPKRRTETARLVVTEGDGDLRRAVRDGVAVAESVCFARDLVNAPPNDLTPTALADAAQSEGQARGLSVKVWDKKALEKLEMNLFLAVNRGSAEEPRMVHMVWKPKKRKEGSKRVCFVGKGLTFDSGGLCIKPGKSMVDMKCDMAGAAATVGIMLACARLELPLEVHGFFGATENMTGPSAYRPGDVFTSYEGKTVEIINTDAEGRLVLADVLAYAAKEVAPDYLIDHATLTGACMVALGQWTAGLFANDDSLAAAYAKAAASEGEPFWRMPLDAELRDSLKSDIADMKHMGDGHGGSITAALFLQEFVGKTNWMHLDIAGPAFLDRPHNQYPKGGTGFGIATAVRFLESLVG